MSKGEWVRSLDDIALYKQHCTDTEGYVDVETTVGIEAWHELFDNATEVNDA